MTESQPSLLKDLDEIPLGEAPTESLLIRGRAARRRRRAAFASAVAVVAVVAGGGALASVALTEQDQQADGSLPADGSGEPPGSRSTGGDGVDGESRRVGINTTSIEVPRGWASNDASCNTPVRNTYYYPYDQDCAARTRPSVSSVAIAAGTFPGGDPRASGVRPAGSLNGHEIVQTTATCDLSVDGGCSQAFAVPDLNAYYYAVVQPEDGGLEALAEIRGSLTRVGRDQTIVPVVPRGTEDEVRSALRQAGLGVEIERATCPPNANCLRGVVDMEPAGGTVVPAGSTVTITILDS